MPGGATAERKMFALASQKSFVTLFLRELIGLIEGHDPPEIIINSGESTVYLLSPLNLLCFRNCPIVF